MLIARMLGPEGENLGVLNDDFIFRPFESCIIHSVGFFRNKELLFRTDLDIPRDVGQHDEVRVNLDSGIGFYYLVKKVQEPFKSVEDLLTAWRTIRKIAGKIKNERQARDELGTWNKQIYEMLFNEKQQSFPGGDSRLLVQRGRGDPVGGIQMATYQQTKPGSGTKPISPTIALDRTKKS
jgi:hypothetical protein